VPATRQAVLGIGSILALIVGLVVLVTISPLAGVIIVIMSPVLAAYAAQS
jgi:hypothetical protein